MKMIALLVTMALVASLARAQTVPPSLTSFLAEIPSPRASSSASASGKESCTSETILDKLKELNEADGNLGVTIKAIYASGLGERLGGGSGSPITFYAPINSAWSQVQLNEAPFLKELGLSQLLQHHAVVSDKAVEARILGSATVLKRAQACNGEIRVIDRALVPPLQAQSAGRGATSQAVAEDADPMTFPADTAPRLRESVEEMRRDAMATPLPVAPLPPSPPSTSCKPGACCDIDPPGIQDCFTQRRWGKCDEEWMILGGYCRKTCERCSMMAMAYPNIAHDLPTRFVQNGILYQQWQNLTCEPIRIYWNNGRVETCAKDRVSGFQRTTSPFMKREADYEEVIAGGGVFSAPPSQADYSQSGARMSGWFCPPQEGFYQFYLSSDDSSRLYILEEEDLATDIRRGGFGAYSHYRDYIINQQPYVKVDGWKYQYEWEAAFRKKEMRPGKPYLLEVHHKNGDGRGHLKLGVRLPSGEVARPIPSYFFTRNCR